MEPTCVALDSRLSTRVVSGAMAQYTGGTDFDLDWEETSNALLALLREAADEFATGRAEPAGLTPETVVTTMVWFIARRQRNPYCRLPLRFFDGRIQLSPIEDAFLVLAGARRSARRDEVIDALTRIIAEAADEWTLGDPEAPDARAILRATCGVLWHRRLIPHPPSMQYPRGTWP